MDTSLDNVVADWKLISDGPADGTSLPVRSEGVPAVLKIDAHEHAHLVLRRWNGDGAVRLLRADPHRNTILVERFGPGLGTEDDAACAIVATLYPRLHVPAMPQLSSLPTLLEAWSDDFTQLPRSAPIPHRLIEQAVTLCRDLATLPADHVLHGDLHYGTVRSAGREPWLATFPAPVNGDPAFEVAPMLWNRWDRIADAVRWGVQRRFYALVDAAGFDEERARSWALLRIVRAAVDSLVVGTDLTRWVTLAKALQH